MTTILSRLPGPQIYWFLLCTHLYTTCCVVALVVLVQKWYSLIPLPSYHHLVEAVMRPGFAAHTSSPLSMIVRFAASFSCVSTSSLKFVFESLNATPTLDWKLPHSPELSHLLGPVGSASLPLFNLHNSVSPRPLDGKIFLSTFSSQLRCHWTRPFAITQRDASFPSGQT